MSDRDLEEMYDFIERVDPFLEFDDAMKISGDLVLYADANSVEDLMETAPMVYPKLWYLKENIGRYEFATRFLDGTEYVLDVPCGTGYGTAILASNGNSVLGIDIDSFTIESARDRYKFPNVEFVVGDMMEERLPEVDVIVCFEGIEHVTPGAKLIERFLGVLSDRGRLIISVPINEDLVRPDAKNPYHEEDYDFDSFRDLLETYFESVSYFGVDQSGAISDVGFAFSSIIAVCEV